MARGWRWSIWRAGAARIAHVTGPERFRLPGKRAEGWAAALAQAGLSEKGRGPMYGRWSEAWGHEAVAALWDAGERPDAVFCGNDQIARGVIDALRERGVRVPRCGRRGF